MADRTAFPRVFWVANSIEVLERFAYYGIFMTFGIYMNHLGYTMDQLGIIQSIFLGFSYLIPVISGTLADKVGFKTMLIVSYAAYLPSVLLLIVTRSFSGIALAMLCIGLAAGLFKPLISATIRTTTDKSNKTLGFGIFYQMVNIGGAFGPLVAGKLRAISWNTAFYVSASYVVIMLLVTVFFYKEPPRELTQVSVGRKLKEILTTLGDFKFALFLMILGIFFWLPFWAFFNLIALYIDKYLDTARLYLNLKAVLGSSVADFLSVQGEDGVRHILGETIGNSGYFIIAFQLLVSSLSKRIKAMKALIMGLLILAGGYAVMGLARTEHPALIFLGIGLFAVGEMAASPRVQEYLTWIAPKEKAGLYMGSHFLAVFLGSVLSGVTYTTLFGSFAEANHPEYVWYALAGHIVLGVGVLLIFGRFMGEFKELDA